MTDKLDRKIINHLQDGFPIADEPFAIIAKELGIAPNLLLKRIEILLQQGVLSRFGPLFDPERMGGAVTLAALSAPQERFDEIAALVNAHKQVAHNYARTHKLNMWFVVTGKDRRDIASILQEIRLETGLEVYDFPKEKEFFIGLRLEV